MDNRRSRYRKLFLKILVVLMLAGVVYASAENLSRRWVVGWDSIEVVAVQPSQDGEVTLAIGGDVMLARRVADSIHSTGGGDYRFPFRHVRSYLREADIATANLESPISDRGEPIEKKFVFRVPSRAIPALVDAGFDVLSLANNHILDYGPEAAEDTGRLLSDAGIRWGGLVEDDAAQEPVILTVRGVRVGFLFYCDPAYPTSCAKEYLQYPVRPPFATEETLARDIRRLNKEADIVVVSVHWGVEYKLSPEERTIARARWIIDQGADILIGHHPHVQQRAELYKHGVIFYSTGNFVFDQNTWSSRRISRLYRVTAGPEGVRSVVFLPLEIRYQVWEAVPMTNGYVGLDADSARRRLELPGSREWWRVWVPKFWRPDFWR